MNFIAIDVETANADRSSICSIGAAVFENRQLTSEWYSLVNPTDHFYHINVAIHGITDGMVLEAPTYAEVSSTINRLLDDAVVITHTPFDRLAVHRAARRYGVEPPRCSWLDSALVARRTWKECAKKGYGLSDLCRKIGHEFRHHDALEDAKAAGQVMLAALAESGRDLEIMLSGRTASDRLQSPRSPIKRPGVDGPLFGEVVVFTGALDIPRREAADMAAAVGCEVAPSVTKRTTLLVIGDLDARALAGHEKSAKHRKAEKLIDEGLPIRIICEADFYELTRNNCQEPKDAGLSRPIIMPQESASRP